MILDVYKRQMLGYAQTDENGKERVYIDYFSRPGTISNILAEALRNKVIEGIPVSYTHLPDVGTGYIMLCSRVTLC